MSQHHLRTTYAVLTVLAAISGCAPSPGDPGSDPARAEKPVVETVTLEVAGRQVVGARLLRADGAPLAYLLRADHGVVVCPNFDVAGMESSGTAAAVAKEWSDRGIEGELDAKVRQVNAPAAALGVTVGMPVREALVRMMQSPRQAFSVGGHNKETR